MLIGGRDGVDGVAADDTGGGGGDAIMIGIGAMGKVGRGREPGSITSNVSSSLSGVDTTAPSTMGKLDSSNLLSSSSSAPDNELVVEPNGVGFTDDAADDDDDEMA